MPFTLRGEVRDIFIGKSNGTIGRREPHGEWAVSGWNTTTCHAVVVGSRYTLKEDRGRTGPVIVVAKVGDSIHFRYPGNRAWASNVGGTHGKMIDEGKR